MSLGRIEISAGSACSLFAQSMLNQSSHVVYHSHYPCIFYSHRTNHTESADVVVRPDSIRRCDQGAVAHRAGGMLAPDDDVNVARIVCCIVNALVEYFDQPRLLFKRSEQLAHALDVDKVGLCKDVGSSINIDVAARLFAFQAPFTQQDRVLEELVVKRLLFFHELDDLGADRQQAFAAELRVQVACRAIEVVLSQLVRQSNHFVVNDVRRRNQHHEDSLVRQQNKLDVIEPVVGERWRNHDADVLRERREHV